MARLLDSVFSMPNANPTPGADCAGCIDCCKGCDIPSGVPAQRADGSPDVRNLIRKPNGVPCWWLNTSGPQETWGCKIYAMRPLPCRTYKCWAVQLLERGDKPLLIKAYDILRSGNERGLSKEADLVK